MGISESRVHGLARLAGIELTLDGEPLTKEEQRSRSRFTVQRRRKILSLLREGMTLREIGDELDLTKQRIHQIVSADPLLSGARKIANDNLVPSEVEAEAEVEQALI